MICPYQIGIIVLAADSITIHALAVEQDSMPRIAYAQDLTRLLHFADDWELDENDFKWDKVFDFLKHDPDHDAFAASHCIKWALIEDAYVMKRW